MPLRNVFADHGRGGAGGGGGWEGRSRMQTCKTTTWQHTPSEQGDEATQRSGNPQSEIRNPQSLYEEIDYDELLEPVHFSFAIDRRSFVQMLGAGVLVTALGTPAFAQRRGGRGRRRRFSRWAAGGAFGADSLRRRRHDHRALRQSGGGQGRGANWRRRRPKSCACR